MKKLFNLRCMKIVKKDLIVSKNKFSTILFLDVFYFSIAFFSLKNLEKYTNAIGGDLTLFFLFLFFLQSGLIISLMLFPIYIYPESMKDKHEVYFAYQYTIREIVVGKSLLLSFISLLPVYLFITLFYPFMFEFSAGALILFFLVVPIVVFGLIALNVLAIWFSRIGKLSNILLIITIILVFSKVKPLIQIVSRIPAFYIPLIGLIFSVLLIVMLFVLSEITSIEKNVLKS